MRKLLTLMLPCLLLAASSGCECCRWMYGSAASPVPGASCPVPATTYSPSGAPAASLPPMLPGTAGSAVGTPGCSSCGPQLYPGPQTYTPAPVQ